MHPGISPRGQENHPFYKHGSRIACCHYHYARQHHRHGGVFHRRQCHQQGWRKDYSSGYQRHKVLHHLLDRRHIHDHYELVLDSQICNAVEKGEEGPRALFQGEILSSRNTLYFSVIFEEKVLCWHLDEFMNDGGKYLKTFAWLRNFSFFFSYNLYGLPAHQELGPGMVRYKIGGGGKVQVKNDRYEGKPR